MNAKSRLFLHLVLIVALLSTLLAAQESTARQDPDSSIDPDPVTKSISKSLPPTNDPKEIVRRSVEADHHNWELARSYTCRQHEIQKRLDKHGEAKSTEIKTYDVNFYYGREYSYLTEKNDEPLSASERKKEDEKLEKFLAKLRNESEEERAKHEAKEKKEREEGRAFLRDMVNAYDFTLLGDET